MTSIKRYRYPCRLTLFKADYGMYITVSYEKHRGYYRKVSRLYTSYRKACSALVGYKESGRIIYGRTI